MSDPIRPVRLGSVSATIRPGSMDSTLITLNEALGPYPATLTDRLVEWAKIKPNQEFLSMRRADGSLTSLTYSETLVQVEAIGTALLERNLSENRPIAILSENDIENALLVLAALHVGIPYVPVSPAYSLLATDYLKLRSVLDLVNPGLVFASNGSQYGRAIRAVAPADAEIFTVTDHLTEPASTPFASLLGSTDAHGVRLAHNTIGPDTIAKIMFTSGTTGVPKGVIFPHRMLASQRQQVAQTFAFTLDEPAVMVDWLPWHHTFGGTQNFGTALYSGGSLRIDIGRPTPDMVQHTVQNLREVAPTLYLNTPGGFAALLPYLNAEPELRKTFFSRLKLIYYGGATLPLHIWNELDRLAVETTGERIMITSGVGCTEAGPVPASANWDPQKTALVGLPVPGVEIKVAPVQGKLEFRIKGPCVTPGYFKQPELTAAAFDEEGFYKSGDAVRFIDPDRPELGLRFDGRLAENFKLGSGTWVHVADIREKAISVLSPYATDVVITAPERAFLGAIVFPDLEKCRALAKAGPEAAPEYIYASDAVRNVMQQGLDRLAREGTGQSNTVQRLVMVAEPATLDNGELTDKRSVSQKAVLARRLDVVAALYADNPGPDVIVAQS